MSFTKAAERLHITQPAVSQHIRYLERDYGAKLFEYEGKRLHLTGSGELLRRTAAAQRNDDRLLRERLSTGPERGFPLHFGATMTIGEFAAARPLAAYLAAHPHAEIQMEIANTEVLLRRIRQGELHFALVEGYFDRQEFESMLFSTERFIAVCASHHRFEIPPDRLRALLGERVLAREPGSGTRDILEKHLAAQNLALSDFADVAQIGGMQTILQLLALDAGISFLYERAARAEIVSGNLREIPLSDFRVEHDFTMVWERGSANAPEYRAICKELLAADD